MKLSTCAYFALAALAMTVGYASNACSDPIWSPKQETVIDGGGGAQYTAHQTYSPGSMYTTCCPLTNGVPNCKLEIFESGMSLGEQDASLVGGSNNGTGNVQGHQSEYDGPAEFTITLHGWCYTITPQADGSMRRVPDIHPEPSYLLDVHTQSQPSRLKSKSR